MLGAFTNIAKTAAAFLQTGVAPPNTPAQHIPELSKRNHLSSKKFFVVFVSVAILCLFFYSSVSIMFFLPRTPEIITGFVTLFTKTSEILAIVISTYLGVQAAVDFKINSGSNVSMNNNSQTSTQNLNQTITETITVIHTNQKEDDYELS